MGKHKHKRKCIHLHLCLRLLVYEICDLFNNVFGKMLLLYRNIYLSALHVYVYVHMCAKPEPVPIPHVYPVQDRHGEWEQARVFRKK